MARKGLRIFFQMSFHQLYLFSFYLIWNFGYISFLLSPAPFPQSQPAAFLSGWGDFRANPVIDLPSAFTGWYLLVLILFPGHWLFKKWTEFVREQGNLSPWLEIQLLRQLATFWDHNCRRDTWQDLRVPVSFPGQQLSLCFSRPGSFCVPFSFSAGRRNVCLCLFSSLLSPPISCQTCWDDRNKMGMTLVLQGECGILALFSPRYHLVPGD